MYSLTNPSQIPHTNPSYKSIIQKFKCNNCEYICNRKDNLSKHCLKYCKNGILTINTNLLADDCTFLDIPHKTNKNPTQNGNYPSQTTQITLNSTQIHTKSTQNKNKKKILCVIIVKIYLVDLIH
jgi:hypothetical protein